MVSDSLPGANILASEAEVWVNAVNIQGRPGKGIALEIALAFPEWKKSYQQECSLGLLKEGDVSLWINPRPDKKPKYIFNAATKGDPSKPSEYAWVESCLKQIEEKARTLGVKTVACPALGSGLGRLDPKKTRAMAENIFKDSPVNLLWHDWSQKKEHTVTLKQTPESPKIIPKSAYRQRDTRTISDEDIEESTLLGRKVFRGFVRDKEGKKQPAFTLIKSFVHTDDDKKRLDRAVQRVLEERPVWRQKMPKSGTDYRYMQSNAGTLKWTSNESGMFYEENRTQDNRFVQMPKEFLDTQQAAFYFLGLPRTSQMQTGLINIYEPSGSLDNYNQRPPLNIHADTDEHTSSPVFDMSLGDSCRFLFMGQEFEKDPYDVLVFHDAGRFGLHAVKSVSGPNRINITLREVVPERLEMRVEGDRMDVMREAISEQERRKAEMPIKLRIENASVLRAEQSRDGKVSSCNIKKAAYVGRSPWVFDTFGAQGLTWERALRNQHNIAEYNGKSGPAIFAFAEDISGWDRGEKRRDVEAKDALLALDRLDARASKDRELTLICHCAPSDCHCNVLLGVLSERFQKRGQPIDVLEKDQLLSEKYLFQKQENVITR